jgi:hypothetical protein
MGLLCLGRSVHVSAAFFAEIGMLILCDGAAFGAFQCGIVTHPNQCLASWVGRVPRVVGSKMYPRRSHCDLDEKLRLVNQKTGRIFKSVIHRTDPFMV